MHDKNRHKKFRIIGKISFKYLFFLTELPRARPQSIDCLVHISFAIKNKPGGWVKAKKFRFFEKNICILPVGYLTSSAK